MNKQQKIKALSEELERLEKFLDKKGVMRSGSAPHLFGDHILFNPNKPEEQQELRKLVMKHRRLQGEWQELTGIIIN